MQRLISAKAALLKSFTLITRPLITSSPSCPAIVKSPTVMLAAQIACWEVREYSHWSILQLIIFTLKWYESSLLVGLFMIFPWTIALLNLSWILYMHFKIYRFNQLIVNLVQIGAFISFLRFLLANNTKSIAIKNGKFEICNGNCWHSNWYKIINVSDWML